MKTDNHYPFTLEQLNALSTEQRQAIEAVAEYLTGSPLTKHQHLTNEELSSIFNLLRAGEGCVASEEADEDLLKAIRKKFCAVYRTGMELAEAELKPKNTCGFNFCLVIDASYEDTTHIAILDYDRPVCYLHEWTKAWHLGFTSLAELGDAVLQVRKCLVEKVAAYATKEIFVIMEDGLVHEITNLPPNLNVTVIDYDIEGVEKERLEVSPVDGELCTINKW